MTTKLARRSRVAGFAAMIALGLGGGLLAGAGDQEAPRVVVLKLDQIVHPLSAEYVVRGIQHANQINADAILIQLDTPGGLEKSMRDVVGEIIKSGVPVITYVAPSGGRAASAGFFILLAGDIAVMAPGTHTGAAHPVILGGAQVSKTMEEKIRNDAAAYIRSIADKRQRNAKLAEEGVRESKSYTEKEALEGKLIDAVANTPRDIFAMFDGKTVRRFNDTTSLLHLANASTEPYSMTSRERFFSHILDPNIAFILAALGVLGLYIEFTHPGMIAPGVFGAIALVLALFAFHLLPINYTGVILIVLALVLFILEANIMSHGVLAVGGILALVIGALILIESPWPEARIHLSTALAVAVPLAVITVLLLRLAIAAQRSKAVTGMEGMVGAAGRAQTDIDPEGKVLVHGELWSARARDKIPANSRVQVRAMDGLTLLVEVKRDSE